jgi:hypothetical protein
VVASTLNSFRGGAVGTLLAFSTALVGRFICGVDAHRDDGKRFVVHADEKLTALLELESATRMAGGLR